MRIKIQARIVEKAATAREAEPALMHVALDDGRGGVALAAQRLGQVAASIVKNVATAPVDELQHAEHGEAEAEAVLDRFVDLLRRRHALLDHARGLVHSESLDARDDVSRPRRTYDR